MRRIVKFVIGGRLHLSSLSFSFKSDKEIGEIKFERSDLKGVDRKSLHFLPNVERFSFASNGIEKLSPGG